MTIRHMCEAADVSRAGFYRRHTAGRPTRHRSARRDSKDRPGVPLLWPAACRRRVEAPRLEGEPQAGSPDHAGGQLAVPAPAEVRRHHRFQPLATGSIRIVAAGMETDCHQSTLGSRYYLHSAGNGVCLSGGGSGRLLTSRGGLGAGPNAGSDSGNDGIALALQERSPAPGLVHHSDRGVQYASVTTRDLLKEHGITISMSRKGNPYDNAACESFMKTLKYEEVHRQEYRDMTEALASIGELSRNLTIRSGSARRWVTGRRWSLNVRFCCPSSSHANCCVKREGALRSVFSGMRNLSVRCVLTSFYPWAGPAFRSGRSQGIGRAGKNTPCPSSAMSSGWLFLDRVARQHCPSPLHQRFQDKGIVIPNARIYHLTVASVLTAVSVQGATPNSHHLSLERLNKGNESLDSPRR